MKWKCFQITVFCEGSPQKRTVMQLHFHFSNMELLCSLLSEPEETVKKPVELMVIWDVMTFICRHCNQHQGSVSISDETSYQKISQVLNLQMRVKIFKLLWNLAGGLAVMLPTHLILEWLKNLKKPIFCLQVGDYVRSYDKTSYA